MVQQQICPACTTANSIFASACRICSAPFGPSPSLGVPPVAPQPSAAQAAGKAAPAAQLEGIRLAPVAAPLEGISLAPRTHAPADAAPVPSPSVEGPAEQPVGFFLDTSASTPAAAGDTGGWFSAENPAAAFEAIPAPAAAVREIDPSDGLGFLATPVVDRPTLPNPDPNAASQPAPAPGAWPAPSGEAPPGFHLNQWGTGVASGAEPAVSQATPPPAPVGTVEPDRSLSSPPDDDGVRGWGVREQAGSTPPVWGIGPDAAASPAQSPAYGYPVAPGSMPTPWPEAQAGPVARGSRAWVALLLIVVVAAVGAFAYLRYEKGSATSTHTVALPSSIGGVPQNNDPSLASAAHQMVPAASAATGLTQAVGGFYGDLGGGTPEFAVILGAASRPMTQEDASGFVKGFNSTAPGAFDMSRASKHSDGGVEFACGPVGSTALSMCFWLDGNVIGAVLGFPGVASANVLAEAQATRATAEH